MTKKCNVEGCTSSAQRMFKFPDATSQKERFLKWLSASGNTSLLRFSTVSIRSKTICIKHFEAKYILSKKLSNTAVPTLHLPDSINVSSYKIQAKEKTPDENAVLSPNEPWNESQSKGNSIQEHQKELRTIGETSAKTAIQPIAIPISYTVDRNNNVGSCEEESATETESHTGPTHKRRLDSSPTFTKRKHGADRKGGTLLSFFGLRRKSELLPKENHLYNLVAQLKKTVQATQKRNISLRARLRRAMKMTEDGSFDALADLPETSRNFLISHFRNVKRNKHHRLYSMKDKIFAVALYKRSAAAYRFLQDILTLPSIETLRKLIQKIPIEPGISRHLFESLHDKLSREKDYRSKYCILIFDEMSLDPTLSYNKRTGTIDGFIDTGYERKASIANHVMVWMLKGIQGTWKQPILYTFCNATTEWVDIVRIFKDIVKEANEYGITIVSSICDQGATNVKAINKLIEGSKGNCLKNGDVMKKDVIIIDGQTIVPLFDPPHLMKCIRNNLLTKDVKFTMKDGIERVAKWSHIQTAYEIDKARSLSLLKKLSDYHIYVEKIPKMRVKYCTQVFSYTVAAAMDLMSLSGTTSPDGTLSMPTEGEDTAKFVNVMNSLFDSVNGGLKAKTVTATSNEKWDEYIHVLRSMTFIKSKHGDRQKPIVLRNFISTLQGFKLLKSYLDELGFKEFSTRVFNQDAVENFFGQIKQHGIRDNKPNCTSFHAHYRTLLLKNFSQKRSRCNCEADEVSDFMVDLEMEKLQKLITTVIPEKQTELPTVRTGLSLIPYEEFRINLKEFRLTAQRFTKKCKICDVNVSKVDSHNSEALTKFNGMIAFYISSFVHVQRFGKLLIDSLIKRNFFQFGNCDHTKELHAAIVAKYVELTINQYLRKVRDILSGNESLQAGSMDTLMLQAQKLYKNRTCRNKKVKK